MLIQIDAMGDFMDASLRDEQLRQLRRLLDILRRAGMNFADSGKHIRNMMLKSYGLIQSV